jgi:hypothetical protein
MSVIANRRPQRLPDQRAVSRRSAHDADHGEQDGRPGTYAGEAGASPRIQPPHGFEDAAGEEQRDGGAEADGGTCREEDAKGRDAAGTPRRCRRALPSCTKTGNGEQRRFLH